MAISCGGLIYSSLVRENDDAKKTERKNNTTRADAAVELSERRTMDGVSEAKTWKKSKQQNKINSLVTTN